MPAERRSMPMAKPLKTERTHEENQERAYIAASRRSDRSLEARIESARRASEIHKKRTGRALRVTEQDVANEEMYEEEDDDLPTQYQRLNAHLHTTSVMFNRKLHDYIATQHGVRNMFMSQYQNPSNPSSFQPYGNQFQANGGQYPHMQGLMNQSMLPPQTFNSSTQANTQPSQPFSPQGYQQQSFRQSPYHIPPRPQAHQRSASIPTPHHGPNNFAPHMQQSSGTVTTPGADTSRRMSLPPQALDQPSQPSGDSPTRPPLSRTTTAQSLHRQPASPQRSLNGAIATPPSGQSTPQPETSMSMPYPFTPMGHATSSQVLSMNPLSMSLPPEAQQFVGSSLDPNDSRTAMFMAGSDNLPQPFAGSYTYNPNLSPKSARRDAALNMSSNMNGMAQTLAPCDTLKLETSMDGPPSTDPSSAMTENMFSTSSLFTPTGFEFSNYFDPSQSADMSRTASDQRATEVLDDDTFFNWSD